MATTHAVNLIDGIDGLAISQMWIMQMLSPLSLCLGKTNIFVSLVWYYFFIVNRYKAKIFMGDIGAFFLGGYLASSFIAARCELLLIITGIVLVINTLMVIQQTIYYKLYKLRFFSFTPYHHALEMKGWSENKICLVYGLITCIGSLLSMILYCRYF
jgi:phospho-N-acetylmuramoyl-pentapeptide-transferase